MISRTHLILAGLALASAAPALAGPDYSPSKKGQYPSTNFNAPDMDKLTVHGAGSTGEIPSMTVGGRPLSGLLSAVPQIENGQVKFFNGPVLGTIGPDGKFTLTPDSVTAPSFTLTGPGLSGPIDSGTVGGTAIPTILGTKAPLVSPTFSGTVTAPSFTGGADALTVGGATLPSVLGTKAPLANPIFSGTVTAPALNVSGATNVGSLTTPGAVTAGSVTGDGAGITVGGTAIPAILGSKAPLASPTFSGTVTAPSISVNGSGLAGPIDNGTVGGTAIPTLLGAKAPLLSPTFSGTVTAPALSVSGAASVGSLTTAGGISANTLAGDGAGVTVGGTAIPTILGTKAPIANPTFSGTVTAPSFAGDGSAVTVGGSTLPTALGAKAPLASPTFTGTVMAPAFAGSGVAITAPRGDGTLQRLDGVVPTLDIARSEIGSRTIPLRSFVVSGYATASDAGAGARYVRGSSAGPMAVQDAAGTWWQLDLSSGEIRAEWFGVVANSPAAASANAAAINLGIAALGARGGGVLILPPGQVYVGATVDNTFDYVLVRGWGRVYASYGTPAYSTTLVPTFAGTVLQHRSLPDANHIVSGGGFDRLRVIGNGIATRLLLADTTWGGTYHLSLENSVGSEAALFYGRTVAGGPCIQHADIDLTVTQTASGAASNAHGVVFDGDPSANVSMNKVRLDIGHVNGDGLRLGNSDNNIIWLRTFRFPGGTGASVRSKAGTTEAVTARANVFEFLTANSAPIFEGTESAAHPSSAVILHSDQDNGTPMPTLGAGAFAPAVNVRASYTPTISALSGSVGSGAVARGEWTQSASGRVSVNVAIDLPNGAGASGLLAVTLPTPIRGGSIEGVVSGKEIAKTGKGVAGIVSQDSAGFQFSDGSFQGQNGMSFRITFEYQG